jgi:competence protein ComEC
MSPLLLPLTAVCLAVGAVLGTMTGGAPVPLLALAGGLVSVGLLCGRRPLLCAVALCAGAVATGTALAAVAVRRPLPDCHVARRAGGRQAVRLHAEVVDPPVATAHGQRATLRARALLGRPGDDPVPLCGAVDLRLTSPSAPALFAGEQVVVRSRLRPAVGSRNPGTAGSRLRLLSGRIGAVVYADAEEVAVIGPGAPSLLGRVRRRIRQAMERAGVKGDPRAILGALVLGEREAVGQQLRRTFARAGVSHLLAVSGLHLTLLAGGVLLVLRRLLLRVPWLARRTDVRRVAAPLAVLAAVAYTVLTGAAPSTVRACVMSCACFLGLCCARRPDLTRPLGLAAVLLIAADPLNLLRPGFQLSFAAVIGIGLAASRRPHGSGLLAGVRSLALATLAATLITAPVVAHHFHEVSWVGLLTNLVAIPATTFVLLPLALIGAVLGLIHPIAGKPLLVAAGWAADGLHRLCAVAGGHDAAILGWSPSWLTTVACCLAVLAVLLRTRRRAWLALAALVFVVSAGQAAMRRLSPALEVTFLDVGQGDSTFVRFPDGRTLLVDAGGSHTGSWDPGTSRVVPFLRSAGVRRLDLVVASHPHPDHVAGLVGVLEAVEVSQLWVCWPGDENPWHRALLQQARRRRVPVARPRALRWGEATITPLWPASSADGSCGDPGHTGNDNSVVLRIAHGRAVMLLAGDVEQPAEEELLARHPRALLAAQLLKVPHHGSNSSSSAAFLEAVRPRLAVIPCGVGNRFGFPHRRVLERYRAVGATVARIDQLGAVGVRLQADGTLSWRPLCRW